MKLPKFLYRMVSNHNTSLGDNKAFPPEDNYCFDYRILKKRFGEVFDNINNSDIINLDEIYLSNTLSALIKKCKEIEKPFETNLIKLCENIVNEALNVPDDTVNLNCKLVDKVQPINAFRIMPEDSESKGFDFEDLVDFDNASKVILKRRMINSLIQGAAYDCCSLIKAHLAELESFNQELPKLYEQIILINDYLLFTKEEKISDKKPMQGSCVEVMLGMNGERTEINAQGIIFPFLLNDTFRGFFELFASHGLPKDNEKANYIIKQADFLLAEPWDLRMGVPMWRILSKGIEDSRIFPYFFTLLCKMEVDEFNESLREIYAQTKKGKSIVNSLCHEASHIMNVNKIGDTIKKKNDEIGMLNDSYLSSDDLDSYELNDEDDNGIIEEEGDNGNDYIELASSCTLDDIDFREEELDIPQFQIYTIIKGIEFPIELINLRLEPRNVLGEDLYQIHIFLDNSIQHMGLGYKIYSKAIMTYGNLYSGFGRRMNNDEVPKIWDKLKNNFNVSLVYNYNDKPIGIKATL